ncbi:relaxase/mobilization nuclease domain-containing protein (plasmid) [Ampullimonas aquatilis]|uniref:relaxase/mobilization nuclease domain-containing protein n=1 Tax=Ampullimonas aquatilis TaxID=1341549 RepID=UPI003C74BDA9
MSHPKQIDGILVDWGDGLFNMSPVQPVKQAKKRSLTGLTMSSKSPKTNTLRDGQSKPALIRKKLTAITNQAPQAVVKISGGGKGMKVIAAHFSYISRHGKLDLEDQDGNIIKGKDGLKELADEWANTDIKIPDEGQHREAFNIVLSMPEGTDPIGVKRAARDFAAREFPDHQYVMALHTFETDPDKEPSKHPHVHLAVKARNENGVKLNPRKADLARWREDFALALNENGIEASSINRAQRLQRERGEKLSVRKMQTERGVKPHSIGKRKASPEIVAKAKKTEKAVLTAYHGMVSGLMQSSDPADKTLATKVMDYLAEGKRMNKEPDMKSDGEMNDR